MFGIVVAGRLVQTDFQQVSETQYVFTIPDADTVNHVVIFMTGLVPFSETHGAAAFFGWPSKEDGMSWKLLGHLSNAKPSAVFKVAKLKPGEEGHENPFGGAIQQSHSAQIGISVEPLDQIAQMSPCPEAAVSNLSPFVEYTNKMLENFYNFASSFSVTQSQMAPNPTETFVPLSTLQQWYTNFKRRLEQSPNFWKN